MIKIIKNFASLFNYLLLFIFIFCIQFHIIAYLKQIKSSILLGKQIKFLKLYMCMLKKFLCSLTTQDAAFHLFYFASYQLLPSDISAFNGTSNLITFSISDFNISFTCSSSSNNVSTKSSSCT